MFQRPADESFVARRRRRNADVAAAVAQLINRNRDVDEIVGVDANDNLLCQAPLVKLIGQIAEDAWVPIPYWLDGAADVAETTYIPFTRRGKAKPMRLIVRRVKPTPGSQLEFAGFHYTYHALIIDREGALLELEADHRRHAVVENAIRDLKDGVVLDHLPSGHFGANGAWLSFNVIAYNLMRWLSRVALGETLVTTPTVRTRHVAAPGWLVRHARQLHLHLPARWPWAQQFQSALERLRSLPVAASTPA
jgi:Transposase DDE domain group 1